MKPFLTGVHHLSLKQVPSSLMLKRGSSQTVKGCRELILESGFTIEDIYDEKSKCYSSHDGKVQEVNPTPIQISELIDSSEISSEMFSGLQEESAHSTSSVSEPVTVGKRNHSRLVYEDFFSVVAGRFFCDFHGLKQRPRIIIWFGDVKRLSDPINPDKFRWEKFGCKPPKNPIRFDDVKSWQVQYDFLLRHTHWGFKLQQMCDEEKLFRNGELPLPEGVGKAPTTAGLFKRVLKSYLSGENDPRLPPRFTQKLYDEQREPPSRESRSKRLLEVLKTVDGIFAQRFCAFPHETWTYEKYDIFILKLIYELITDEFLDGLLSEEGREVNTRFSSLKKVRALFKGLSTQNLEGIEQNPLFREERWLRPVYLPLFQAYKTEKNIIVKGYLNGVLSQKRGAGKPPPLDRLLSKIKFLKTVTIPDHTGGIECKMVSTIMDEELVKLPDHIFTGLSTKAGITVTSSACFEYNVREEGTLHAIQDICKDRVCGIRAPLRDLETGNIRKYFCEEYSEGTYIFYQCLDEVLRMSTDARKRAMLTLVDEPGKNRSVTKAVAVVKVVMDLVNRICSVPLERGFESSTSGMGSANHAWNFFKDFEKEILKDILFKVKNKEEIQYEGTTRVTLEYEDVYVTSTDYETATDFMSHKIGREIAYPWMIKCGIPRVLRNLVCEIAFTGRDIYFTAGNLQMGNTVEGKSHLRFIRTCRGVLMGDPLTKVVLHFTNIVARQLSKRILERDFLFKVFGCDEASEYFYTILRKKYGIRV